ncbi:MAG: mycofactocin-coupled SDR family oxidoreductase, partial [Mycobacterium sp.]
KLDGKVAFITGAGRGQGRSHAIRLAEEGADIIAVDICADLPTVPYSLSSPDDLEHTAKLAGEAGARVVTKIADVRDIGALRSAFDEGVAELGGRIDVVVANAGIMHYGDVDYTHEDDDFCWDLAIGVMLTGVRNTIKVSRKALVEGGRGGSIIIISSAAGLKGMSDGNGGPDGYVAAKHGVVGLMRTYANVLAPHSIRVNTVHPTGVMTPMIMNEFFVNWVSQHPEIADRMTNPLPVPALDPVDVSHTVAFLASDEAKYITGVTMPVDAGFNARL